MEEIVNNWDDILIDIKNINIKLSALLKQSDVCVGKSRENEIVIFFKSKWYKNKFKQYEEELKNILFNKFNKKVNLTISYDGEYF